MAPHGNNAVLHGVVFTLKALGRWPEASTTFSERCSAREEGNWLLSISRLNTVVVMCTEQVKRPMTTFLAMKSGALERMAVTSLFMRHSRSFAIHFPIPCNGQALPKAAHLAAFGNAVLGHVVSLLKLKA